MESRPTLTAYIVVSDAKAAIELYKQAFGATERSVMFVPGTEKVMNAQLNLGDSLLMLNDEFPEHGVVAPAPGVVLPVTFHLQVEDVDTKFAQAVAAGLEVVMPLEDQFWGDRYGQLKDRFGYRWSMASTIADPLTEPAI